MDDRKSTRAQLAQKPLRQNNRTKRTRSRTAGFSPAFLKTPVFWGRLLSASVITASVFFWKTGGIDRMAQSVSTAWYAQLARAGLSVDDLIVEGRSLTPQKEIIGAVAVSKGGSILAADLRGIKTRLEALPWVQTASIQRVLPDTLYVRLLEHNPIAIWQKKNQVFLVDDRGRLFDAPEKNPFKTLPILTGEGAPAAAPELFEIMKEFQDFAPHVTGAVFLGNRRWDILLDNKLRLKLAEGSIKESLERFVHLETTHQITNKDLVAIDLRFKDKVFFQLTPEAAQVKTGVTEKQA